TKELIRFHNRSLGKDIEIEITSLRTDEKLFEELLNNEEGVTTTKHSEISKVICNRKISIDELETQIESLFSHLNNGSTDDIKEYLKAMVPGYSFKSKRKNGKKLSVETRNPLLIE